MLGTNRNFFKALGPGILWAGAAIGVSHLVQSAWLNHRVIVGPEVSVAARPGRGLIFYSWSGIVFSTVFALYFIWVQRQ